MYKLVLITLLLWSGVCFAQTGKPAQGKLIRIISTESLSFDKDKGDAQVLKGNVVCEHEGTLLHCDTAYVYEKENSMVASGHILITKGDSIRVTGQKLVYDGKSRLATLQNNVRCVEKDMVLTTDLLTFDARNSVASYFNGGTIVNKENTLVSRNGHYYSSSKEAAFHYSVVLTNPDYRMNSDTLKYRISNKTAYFLGPSTITSETDHIYCENGWYDTGRELSQFSKNAVLRTKQQTLRGDSLTYDRTAGLGKAFRRVTLSDSSQKSVLYGNYVEYRKLNSEAFVTGGPLYARVMEADSLFLTADTLYHRDIDTVDNFLAAYHHVRIFKKDLQAVSDSATLNTADSVMRLYDSPVLWSNDLQATAKQVEVEIGKKSVKGFLLSGKSFVAQRVDSLNKNKYQQLTGKTISGRIVNDTIRKITVNGNAEMIYYPKNKNSLLGINRTTCSEINMWFSHGEASRVTLKPQTTGNVDPLKDISEENATLKGFTWMEGRRPRSREELRRPVQEKKH